MMRFRDGLTCSHFSEALAIVLHQAAAWSTIAGVTIELVALLAHEGAAADHAGAVFTIDRRTTTEPEIRLAHFRGYLERTLGARYRVELARDRVIATWPYS